MNTSTNWKSEESLTSHPLTNFLREEALESRLTSLRDVALEVLAAVDSLKHANGDRAPRPLNLQDEVRRFESDLIQAALVRTRGNQLRAARLLGVKHTTLNAKIKRYGICLAAAGSNGNAQIAA